MGHGTRFAPNEVCYGENNPRQSRKRQVRIIGHLLLVVTT